MWNTHRVGVTADNIVRYTASSLTVLRHSLVMFLVRGCLQEWGVGQTPSGTRKAGGWYPTGMLSCVHMLLLHLSSAINEKTYFIPSALGSVFVSSRGVKFIRMRSQSMFLCSTVSRGCDNRSPLSRTRVQPFFQDY